MKFEKRNLALFITIITAVACGQKHKDEPTKQTDNSNTRSSNASQQSAQTKDFFSFLGFSYGDNYDKVKQKLGEPSDKSDDSANDFITYYYGKSATGNALSISILRTTNKIYTFWIESKPDDVRALGIDDPHLDLLGQSHDAIIAKLGQPKDPINSTIEYGWTDAIDSSKKLNLDFWCSKPDSCSMISVSWFGTDK